MIFNNSRYFNGPLTQLVDSRRPQYTIAVYRKFPAARYITYSEYTWIDGDAIDALAYRELGDASAWWQIMDMNPHIKDPDNIRPGTVVRVPNA